MDNLQAIQQIDELIKTKDFDKTKVDDLISVGNSIRNYFFEKVSADWLDFLNEKNYFSILSNSLQDPKIMPFVPEAAMLSRVAAEKPQRVLEIIRNTVLPDNANEQVVAEFLKAFKEMPVSKFSIAIKIILDGKWVNRFQNNWRSGFEYLDFLKKITKAGKWKAALSLAQSILSRLSTDKPNEGHRIKTFLDDYQYEQVLEIIQSCPDKYVLQFSKLLRDKLIEFFTIDFKIGNKDLGEHEKNYDSYGQIWCESIDGAENVVKSWDEKSTLFSYFKRLADRLLELNRNDVRALKTSLRVLFGGIQRDIFRRTYCYYLGKYSDILVEDLKKEILNVKNIEYFEFEVLVEKYFDKLNEKEQRQYVQMIKKEALRKSKHRGERAKEYENYFIKARLGIAKDKMLPRVLKDAQFKMEDKLEKAEPQKPFSSTGFHSVGNVSPLSKEKIGKMEISELIQRMIDFKSDKDEFRGPSISGFRDIFKSTVSEHPLKYSSAASKFTNEKLLPDYVYGFFRGLEEVIGSEKENEINWKEVEKLTRNILQRLQNNLLDSQEKKPRGGIEIYWEALPHAMLDFYKKAIESNKTFLASDNESIIFALVDAVKDNKNPEGVLKEDSNDPAMVAINSIRGRAFEVMVRFASFYNKEKGGEENAKKRMIHPKVKEIFQDRWDKEDHEAIWFLFGQYMVYFYYLDKKWTKQNIVKKLESKSDKLRIAFCEGYLCSNIYPSLFELMRDQYSWLITNLKNIPQDRKYFRQIDEGLAQHLAIAFIFEFIPEDDKLLKRFFKETSAKARGNFIGFIGRGHISLNKIKDKEGRPKPDRLKNLWIDRVANSNDADELKEFGWWVDADKFGDTKFVLENLKKVLQKTNGELEGEHLFVDKMVDFAKSELSLFLDILSLSVQSKKQEQNWFRISYKKEIYTALELAYQNRDIEIKQKVRKIINNLIDSGLYEFKNIIK